MQEEPERATILIVDDRADNRLALQAVLARSDYALVLAASGEDALAVLLRRECAVILMDAAMPGLDGFEVLRLIRGRDRTRHVPVIFVTATLSDLRHVHAAYEAGAVDYLVKPVDPQLLRAKVAVFVQLWRQSRTIERASAALRESERRARELAEAAYDATFEHAPVGVGHADLDGRWLRVNEQLATMMGRSAHEMLGRAVAEMAHPDDREVLAAQLHAVARAEARQRDAECRLLGTTGLAHAIVTISTITSSNGSGICLIVVQDVTAQRQLANDRARAMRALEESVRARDEFLHLAAHELRNPLTPLVMQLAMLREHLSRAPDPIAPEWLAQKLAPAERAAARLGRLVDELLDVSRAIVSPLPLERAEMDLAEVTREVAERMRPELDRARCALRLRADDPVVGRWDRARLAQVVEHLLSNAIKYGAGAPIEVGAFVEDDRVRLYVRDHGIGVAREDRARIFDRFERLVSLEKYGGFGVGLWLVRQIVEAHGGAIEVWSEPGEGSRFSVELPRDEPSRGGADD